MLTLDNLWIHVYNSFCCINVANILHINEKCIQSTTSITDLVHIENTDASGMLASFKKHFRVLKKKKKSGLMWEKWRSQRLLKAEFRFKPQHRKQVISNKKHIGFAHEWYYSGWRACDEFYSENQIALQVRPQEFPYMPDHIHAYLWINVIYIQNEVILHCTIYCVKCKSGFVHEQEVVLKPVVLYLTQ